MSVAVKRRALVSDAQRLSKQNHNREERVHYKFSYMQVALYNARISPPASDGLLLLNRAALPRIKDTDSLWKSW